MTIDEAKKEILKMYYDEDMFGEDYISFIDKMFADFEIQLIERYKAGWKDRDKCSDLEHNDCSGCLNEPTGEVFPLECGICSRFYKDKKEK